MAFCQNDRYKIGEATNAQHRSHMPQVANVCMPEFHSSCGTWRSFIIYATKAENHDRNHARLQLAAVREFESQSEQRDSSAVRWFDAAQVMTEIILSFWPTEYAVYGDLACELIRMIMAFEDLLKFEGIFADQDGAACAYALRTALACRGVTDTMVYLRMHVDCDKVFMIDVPDAVALTTKVDAICRRIAECDGETLEWEVIGFGRAVPLIHAFDQMIEHIIPQACCDIAYRFVHIINMIEELPLFRNGIFYSTVLGHALFGTWKRRRGLVDASDASHAYINSIDTMLSELCQDIPVLTDLLTSLRPGIGDDPCEPIK